MIAVNNWDKNLADMIERYTDDVAEKVKDVIDDVADGVMDEIKSHINFKQRTGKYIKAFRLKTTYESQYDKRRTWYVASPHHRLTHLLENGHLSRNGTTRVRAYPHIKYGEEFAQKNLKKEIIKKINE